MEEKEEKIKENIANGLLPCGCERGKCKCPLSAISWTIKYSKYLGKVMKNNKEMLKQNKLSVLKAAKEQMKGSCGYMKKLYKEDKKKK